VDNRVALSTGQKGWWKGRRRRFPPYELRVNEHLTGLAIQQVFNAA
jgi:hypothetical protein